MSYLRVALKSLSGGKFLLPFILLLVLISFLLLNPKPQIISAEGDTDSPTILNVSPEDGSYTPYHKPLISASIIDDISIDASSIVLKVDGQEVQGNYDILTGKLTYIPNNFLSTGVHNVNLQASDLSGNTTTFSRSFTVKTLFSYVLHSDANIEISGNAEIIGDTYSKTDTNLLGDSAIDGRGYATGDINWDSEDNPYSLGTYTGVSPKDYPVIDFDYYKHLAQSKGEYLTGDIHLTRGGIAYRPYIC